MAKVRLEMQGIEIPNKRKIKWRCWCKLELGCGFCSAREHKRDRLKKIRMKPEVGVLDGSQGLIRF